MLSATLQRETVFNRVHVVFTLREKKPSGFPKGLNSLAFPIAIISQSSKRRMMNVELGAYQDAAFIQVIN